MRYYCQPKIINNDTDCTVEQELSLIDYLFHPSSVSALLTEPKSKKDKELGYLSETAKTYLDEIRIQILTGRKKDYSNKYTEKGNINEEKSVEMLQEFLNWKYLSTNKTTLKNDFITGTPDIIDGDTVIDIKSSYDIFTFSKADGFNDQYYVQLQCYMWLTGLKKARLVYVLTNSPDETLMYEKQKGLQWKYPNANGDEAWYLEKEKEIEMLHNYDDLPLSKRIKIFEYVYDEYVINELRKKIVLARDYMLDID
jgi:CRISPR/Cas system-associated exonuclease Cas4 (RecB family)